VIPTEVNQPEAGSANPWKLDPADAQTAAEEIEQEVKDVSEGGKQEHFSFIDQLEKQLQPKPHHRWFDLYSESELACAFGVQPLTLGKWRREGTGPAHIMVGKSVFYHHKAVVQWLGRNTHHTIPDLAVPLAA